VRRVKGEHPRLDLPDREVALGTRQTLAEQTLRLFPVGIRHQDEPFTEAQAVSTESVSPRAVGVAPLPRAFSTMRSTTTSSECFFILSSVMSSLRSRTLPVHAHAREPAAARGDEQLLVLALPVANERSEDEEARALLVFADLVDDLLNGLRDDRDAVIRDSAGLRHARTAA
jgi:hypothetical protein